MAQSCGASEPAHERGRNFFLFRLPEFKWKKSFNMEYLESSMKPSSSSIDSDLAAVVKGKHIYFHYCHPSSVEIVHFKTCNAPFQTEWKTILDTWHVDTFPPQECFYSQYQHCFTTHISTVSVQLSIFETKHVQNFSAYLFFIAQNRLSSFNGILFQFLFFFWQKIVEKKKQVK